MPFQQCWTRKLSHGFCVAVTLPVGFGAAQYPLPGDLTKEEVATALAMAPLRRVSWVGGRVALRLAARELGFSLATIGATTRGAPSLPDGLIGSISHKSCLAVAVAKRAQGDTVGVDLEQLARPRPRIAKLVLRSDERACVDALDPASQWKEIVLRFSLKEAIFKAIDPHVQRYVGFKEARVEPKEDGTAEIWLELKEKEGPFELDGRWMVVDGCVLSSVRARCVRKTVVNPSHHTQPHYTKYRVGRRRFFSLKTKKLE